PERQRRAKINLELRGEHRMPRKPRRRAHSLIEQRRLRPAMRMPRRSLALGPEPRSPGETLRRLLLEIAHANRARIPTPGNKRMLRMLARKRHRIRPRLGRIANTTPRRQKQLIPGRFRSIFHIAHEILSMTAAPSIS